MTDSHDDLSEFLERRFRDRSDGDNSPEREIFDALIQWIEGGCPPPTLSIKPCAGTKPRRPDSSVIARTRA
jgi:hypothetical protein